VEKLHPWLYIALCDFAALQKSRAIIDQDAAGKRIFVALHLQKDYPPPSDQKDTKHGT